ncbi:hypothetical protein Mal64_39450 [Pseudobythopirellula maris]|uniref:Carboxypeptidase regulatory-like domain-containing protein n=1 Tax=Pseudobythopirellula maris TaxID=2527991 RepID=A0A5C5ZFV1_9BACT|nr:hypothetical protein [Pseudobythopirellula maris]TWT86202.1 hypothetical protein Mal64_39450 [Pseudobythopirellula maris]
MHRFTNRFALIVATLAVASSGCNERTATVSGVVQLDGSAMKIGEGQRGMVIFRPVAGGATCTSLITPAGGYSVATGSSAGLAPGDYLVSVRVIELVPGSEGEGASGKPITPAVYSDPLTSGLLFTVVNGVNKIVIDLDSSAGPAVTPTPPKNEANLEEAGPEEAGGAEEEEADAPQESDAATPEPTTDEPTTDEPTTDEPTTDEPATDETPSPDTGAAADDATAKENAVPLSPEAQGGEQT